ncbi:hypothetical protein V6N13_138487 [Hibiscus sabdariffa]
MYSSSSLCRFLYRAALIIEGDIGSNGSISKTLEAMQSTTSRRSENSKNLTGGSLSNSGGKAAPDSP